MQLAEMRQREKSPQRTEDREPGSWGLEGHPRDTEVSRSDMDLEEEASWRQSSDNCREGFLQDTGWAGKGLGRGPPGLMVADAIGKAGFCH